MAAPSAQLTAAVAGDITNLLAALGHHDPAERAQAREALAAVGRPAVPGLVKLLGDRRPHVRWEAAKALTPIADPAAACALVDALQDRDADVRWVAAAGLIALGCGAVRCLLRALIERPDSKWLREGTHHVFHELAGKRVFSALRDVLDAMDQPEPEMAVPLAAYSALHALDPLLRTYSSRS
jgi:HEAT repeat protein